MEVETLVLVKPDAVAAELTGEIWSLLEKAGCIVEQAKRLQPEQERWEAHYAEHIGQPFYPRLLAFMTSGPVVALRVSGADDVVAMVRQLIGPTNPAAAEPHTIRGHFQSYAAGGPSNLVHASDSPESAARELTLWFGPQSPEKG